MYSEMGSISQAKEFVKAMRGMEIQGCAKVLEKRPKAVNSVDYENEKWTAVHYAVDNENWEFLRFLQK